MRRLPRTLVGQIPGALLSFGLHRVSRRVGRTIMVRRHRRAASSGAASWAVVDGALFDDPAVLAITLATMPRWNPHAVTARSTAVAVESSLEIVTGDADRSAGLWTIAVSTYPGFEPVKVLSSSVHPTQERSRVELPAGWYTCVLRYYECNEEITLPSIRSDTGASVPTRTMAAPDLDVVFARLRDNRHWFHSWIQYYVWLMLRLQRWLPEGWVARQYLPVPNPRTSYAYGYLDAGDALRVQTPASLLGNNALYYCIYDRSSLPITFGAVNTPELTTEPTLERAFFLLRLHGPDSGGSVGRSIHITRVPRAGG